MTKLYYSQLFMSLHVFINLKASRGQENSFYSFACRMGIACGHGSERQIEAANQYAEAMGLAFQIRDDMLDQISTVEELGKPIGSDAEEQKTTFMSLYGPERCQQEVHALTEQAVHAVDGCFENAAFLQELARSMEVRRS